MTAEPGRRGWLLPVLGFVGVAGLTVLLLALLTNVFERKQEARQPFVRVVEVTEDTLDPKVWGQNWPYEYDSYLKTALPTTTKYGGRGPGASDGGPAEQKLDREPWLKRIFAGYAFSIDYRDRRGHAFALFDQEQTRRVTEKQQPGACIQCHASNLALYRFAGKGDVMKGFEIVSGLPYQEARNMNDDKGQPLIRHSIACADCHDPKTWRSGSRARASSTGSRPSRRRRASPTTIRTGTPHARRCVPSCADSATSSTTSRARARW
jgi:nitrite reductase (cytochrome c-552)